MVTMPSASSKSSVQPNNTEAGDPWNQALSIVEKKVRNLEKRKVKLDSYKKLVEDGKELNEDQKTAVGQRDAVEKLLEFSKELQRQFTQLNIEFMKNQKKQAKRDLMLLQAAKHDSDTNLVKKILELQQLLDSITEEAKVDFLAGTNGAVQLTESDLNNIDEFYKLITPSDDDEEPTTQVNPKTAAEHIVDLFEASNKEFGETTYKALYDVITKIQSCGYFGRQTPAKEEEHLPNADEGEKAETESSSSGQEQAEETIESYAAESSEAPLQQEPTSEEIPAEVNVNGFNGDNTTEDLTAEGGTPEEAADVMALATNELGLNFLGESEVEAEPVDLSGEVTTETISDKPVETENQTEDDSGWMHTGTNGNEDSHQDHGSVQRGGRGGGGWRGGRPPRGGYRGRGGRGGGRGGGPQVNGARQEGSFRRGGGGPPSGRGGNRGGPRGGPRGGMNNPNRRGGFGGPPTNKQ